MKNVRNSNIELLRIISIIIIVFSHYSVHGVGLTINNLDIGCNRFILELLTLGNLGSIIFILISGYYLVKSKEFKLKKILRIIFQVVFYSSIIYLVLLFLNIEVFSFKNLIYSLFPITFKMYWFATCYIVLYIFHPFINLFLNNISRKNHLLFIYVMILIFSIMHFFTTKDFYGNELIQFLLFYSIGAYLSKYPKNYLCVNHNNYKYMIISALIIILSIIIFDIIGIYINIFASHSIYLLSRTSPFAILLCVSIFSIFINKKSFSNKYINIVSSLIFGVYLISDNSFLRPIIWNDIFNITNYINSNFLIIHIIFTVLLIILICLIIEFIRKYIIEKYLFKLLDPIIDKLQRRVISFINKHLSFN